MNAKDRRRQWRRRTEHQNNVSVVASTLCRQDWDNEPCGLYRGRHSIPPPPASGDLNSHTELSGGRSLRISTMQVFVFHYVCAVTFEVTAHVADACHRTPAVYQM